MKEQNGSKADKSTLAKRAAWLKRRAKSKPSETLSLEAPLAPMLQLRAHTTPRSLTHGRTGETAEFSIDVVHWKAVETALSHLPSPTHVPKLERPILVRLQADLEFEGSSYEKGSLVVVDGTHRIAAAWTLGWRLIYVQILDLEPDDTLLLLQSVNRDPVLPARSKEDIF